MHLKSNSMDESKVDKKTLSNAKRLASLKQRYHEQNSQQKRISTSLKNLDTAVESNKRIKFNLHDDVGDNIGTCNRNIVNCQSGELTEKKLELFESSGSEDEVDDNKRFNIKPQFEGSKGEKLFEVSTAIVDERFKLKENFKESDSDISDDEISETPDAAVDKSEKDQNLEILERVLGFQVHKNVENKAKRKRQYVRYDPESETTSECVSKQSSEPSEELIKKKKVKPIKEQDKPVTAVSKDRYFEINSDLKDVLGSSHTPFSFTQSFNNPDETTNSNHIEESSPLPDTPHASSLFNKKDVIFTNNEGQLKKFFMSDDDPRLKEGVDFFQRTKTMDQIRQEWMATRDVVVESHKRYRRLALKTPKTSVKTPQRRKFSKFTRRNLNRK